MFEIGESVLHEMFGEGKVKSIDGVKIAVLFNNGNTKVIHNKHLFYDKTKTKFIKMKENCGQSLYMINEKSARSYFRNKPEEKLIKSIEERGIKKLVHFTSYKNLDSIISHGLMSRKQLSKHEIPFVYNDVMRLDNKFDGINLSIENINEFLLRSYIKKYGREYVVVELSPLLLYTLFYENKEEKVLIKREYYDYNAASSDTCSSIDDIEVMFPKSIVRKGRLYDRRNKDKNQPTAIQAEIIVEGHIPLIYIRNIKTVEGAILWQNDRSL